MSQVANFQVFQASAGSGKTFTIVKEYLKLCLQSEQQVDNFKHILAITFTNASANDMKEKIVEELCGIIDSKVLKPKSMGRYLIQELGIGEDELRHNAQLLLTRIIHDYSSFCVSTIDAFVQKLSRAFARDLGLPSQYTVSIDTSDVADTITENIGLEISDENTFLVQLLMDFSENRFANNQNNNLEFQLNEFVEKLMSEKAYQKEENNNIKNLKQYKQTLDFLNDKVAYFEKEIKRFVEEFKAVEQRYGLKVEDYWQKRLGVVAFVNKLMERNFEQPSKYFVQALENRKCLTDATKQEANEALLAVLDSLYDYYMKYYGQYLFYKSQRDLLYLYALRTKIREEFARLAKEDEVVHISEFNKLLNTVLGDFTVPFVYERIGEFFHHVFIDEFQDTSVLQWQNLLPLIDNGLSAGAMSMVVGDGKQSIYRFRSGEVEQIVQLPEIYALPKDEREAAFRQYQQNLEDHFIFHNLDTNYRSDAMVVEFNNAFFEKAHKSLCESFQKVYHDKSLRKEVSIAQKADKKETGMVQVELYDAKTQPDYCLKKIGALVQELTQEKGCTLADITVLVRDKKQSAEIANYLNDQGIPVVSNESILLRSSDKVMLLVNTLRYLLHPENEVNVANMLYYRRLTQQPDFDGRLGSLFGQVKEVARGKMAVESMMGIGEAGWLAKTLSQSTCLYDLCASLSRAYHIDSLHDAFLNYFMEEVFNFQSGLKEDIQDFLEFWEKKQEVLSVKSVDENALIITTIHKSKGLEYKVVIYPDAITDLDEKQKNTPAEEWIKPEDMDFEPIPNLEKVLFKLNKSAEQMGEKPVEHLMNERESNRLDNLNLLYVAFTRAKQRLYVMAKQSADKENVIRDFVEDTDIKLNMKSVRTEMEGAVLYLYGDAELFNSKSLQRNKKQLLEPLESVSTNWFRKIQVDSEPSMYWISPDDKMQPREWGELVHQILSEIHAEDDIDSALQPYLLEGVIDQKTAETLKDRFLQMAHHPLIAPAFSKEAKVKNECEILSYHEILRPDRYAELQDVIYLIDYKTGKKEVEHHLQLKNYIFALQGMETKEIRAYLVYLSDPIEVEAVAMDTLF